MGRLIAKLEKTDLPAEARMPLDLLAGRFRDKKHCIDVMPVQLEADTGKDETDCRFQTVPGIGPITVKIVRALIGSMPRMVRSIR